MRILITLAALFKFLGIDRLVYDTLSAQAATCVGGGNISTAISTLERAERFLYLIRSSYLLLTQYRLANLYEQAGNTRDAVALYEGMLRRRLPIAMSGNVRSRLADIRDGKSLFIIPAHKAWTSSPNTAVS